MCFPRPGLWPALGCQHWGENNWSWMDDSRKFLKRRKSNGSILLMAEILHQLIGSLSRYLQGLYIPGSAGCLPSTVSLAVACPVFFNEALKIHVTLQDSWEVWRSSGALKTYLHIHFDSCGSSDMVQKLYWLDNRLAPFGVTSRSMLDQHQFENMRSGCGLMLT